MRDQIVRSSTLFVRLAFGKNLSLATELLTSCAKISNSLLPPAKPPNQVTLIAAWFMDIQTCDRFT